MDMIEEKYGDEVEAVWSAMQNYGKGDAVSWSVIENSMGRQREDRGGWVIIKRVRRKLLNDRQIVTLAEPTYGLRLLTDQQAATEIPSLRQRKARRQINRGLRETDAVDVGLLSPHQAAVFSLERKHMRDERSAIARAKQELETLLRPTRSVMAAR